MVVEWMDWGMDSWSCARSCRAAWLLIMRHYERLPDYAELRCRHYAIYAATPMFSMPRHDDGHALPRPCIARRFTIGTTLAFSFSRRLPAMPRCQVKLMMRWLFRLRFYAAAPVTPRRRLINILNKYPSRINILEWNGILNTGHNTNNTE